MIKAKFEKGKEFQDKLKKIGNSLSSAKGQILKIEQMLPKTEVADSDLKALYDALYKAKLEKDVNKMQIILEEIEKIVEINILEVQRELGDREIKGFIDNLIK